MTEARTRDPSGGRRASNRLRHEAAEKCIKYVIEKEEPRFWDVDKSMEEVANVVINRGSDDSSDNN